MVLGPNSGVFVQKLSFAEKSQEMLKAGIVEGREGGKKCRRERETERKTRRGREEGREAGRERGREAGGGRVRSRLVQKPR